jgi:hypothetical protein
MVTPVISGIMLTYRMPTLRTELLGLLLWNVGDAGGTLLLCFITTRIV